MESEISMQVPTFSIPALKGAAGAKIKDMCATSGAQICISSPRQGDPLTEVLISGTQHSIRIALLLIKMAVLHGRAGDKLTLPAEYLPNKKAEAELNISVFFKETQSRAFHTLYPNTAMPDNN